MWRMLTAENKILKYVQILAARKNQEDWEILAFAEKQADWEILAFAKNQADWEILAFAKNQADWEILAFAEKQADWEILVFAKNQADDRIFSGIEIPAPGEKHEFEEKPASEEKPAGLEKQEACLLFRLGGICSSWLLPGLADDSDVSFSLSYGEKSEDLQFADCSPKKFADLWLQFNKKKFADLKFLDSHIFKIKVKFKTALNGILYSRAWGKLFMKKPEIENLIALSL